MSAVLSYLWQYWLGSWYASHFRSVLLEYVNLPIPVSEGLLEGMLPWIKISDWEDAVLEVSEHYERLRFHI